MTNYNDGKWHGWNGGECPVHPKSTVELRWSEDTGESNSKADFYQTECWTHEDDTCNHIIAFRVIKEHREPREWWIGCNGFAYSAREAAEDSLKGTLVDPIHVREVLE